MSIDFKIEPVGAGYWDLVITNGDLVLVGETEGTWPALVTQNVAFKTMVWLGESEFDRSIGFPWIQSVFGLQPIDGIGALIYDAVISAEGIEGLQDAPSLSLESETGVLSIDLTAKGLDFEVPVIEVQLGRES